MGVPKATHQGKGLGRPCLPAAPGEVATHAGRHGVGPEWPRAAGRPACSPGWAPAPRPCHSGTPRCSALQGQGSRVRRPATPPTGLPDHHVPEPQDQDASGKPFPAWRPQVVWCTMGRQWGLLCPRPTGGKGSGPPGHPAITGPQHCPGRSPAHPPQPPGTARPPQLSSPSGAGTGGTDDRPA